MKKFGRLNETHRRPCDAQNWSDQDAGVLEKECADKTCQWTDPLFPPEDKSLDPDGGLTVDGLTCVWKRPEEISPDAQFIVDGVSRLELIGGEMGGSWLMTAAVSLSVNQQLLRQVVPPDQDLKTGICRFRFWRYGEWVEVLVDTFLPTVDNMLVFTHAPQQNEFWPALLEKAYAKLFGSYQALKDGGNARDALVDFTGGLITVSSLQPQAAPDLHTTLFKAQSRQYLMTCQVSKVTRGVEKVGLTVGMDYAITAVKKVQVSGADVELVRLRSPYTDMEWSGNWSDGSEQWRLVSEDEKRDLNLTYDDDGEFWIAFSDLTKYFSEVAICSLGPNDITEQSRKRWSTESYRGRWMKGATAGGSPRSRKFFINSQYRVEIQADEEGEKGSLLAAVMQKARGKRHRMGYIIYKLTDELEKSDDVIPEDFFRKTRPVATSPTFLNTREVSGRHDLHPGHYVIIPCTMNPDEEAEFLLIVFAEQCKMREMDEGTITRIKSEPVTEEDDTKDARAYKHFLMVGGQDEMIDAYELQTLMAAFLKKDLRNKEFNIEVARTLVMHFSKDSDGKLEYTGFKNLLMKVKEWKSVFVQYDKDRNGELDSYELRSALAKLGFRVSTGILDIICARYRNKTDCMSIQEFLEVAARVDRALQFVERIKKAKEDGTDGPSDYEFIHALLTV